MNLYLDDDSIHGLLVTLLRKAGHDVLIPADIGMSGKRDPEHLMAAIGRQRVLLTKNQDDFELLCDLVLFVGGHHSGVLVICEDQDRKRNMKPKDVVRAIGNLIKSGVPIADGVHVLNFYR